MLFETLLGLVIGVLDDNLGSLQEVLEGHAAVLFVLGLSEGGALSMDHADNMRGRLGAVEFGLLLRLLLGDHNSTEALKLIVVLKVEVLAGLGQMGKVEAELNGECVGGLAHLNGLDLGLSLGAGGELEGLKLTEHFHVALELELGCLDDIILGLLNCSGLEGHANIRVLLLDGLALLGVLHVLADGELVVLSLELDPLASLLGDGNDGLLVLDLSLTEASDVLLLVLLLVGSELQGVHLGSLGSKGTASLAGDDGSEDDEVLKLEGSINLGGEVAMGVHSFTHSEFGVIVLGCSVGGFAAAP